MSIRSLAFLFLVPTIVSAAETIKVGTTVALTGNAAINGIAIKEATQACFKGPYGVKTLKDINLELVAYDDGYEPRKANENALKLVREDKVFALLTIYGAPVTTAVLPIVEQEDIPLLNAISSANYAEPVKKNIFSLRTSAFLDVEHMVERFVKDRGVKRFSILMQDDLFGTSGLNALEKSLKARGMAIASKGTFKRNTEEVDEAIKAIAEGKPEVVFLYGVGKGVSTFVNKFSKASPKTAYAGNVAVGTPAFFKDLEGAAIELYIALASPPMGSSSPLIQEYMADLKSAGFSTANQIGVDAYLSCRVFVKAIEKSGAKPTRAAFLKALESFNDLKIADVTVSFSPTDHRGLKTPIMVSYKDKKLVQIQNIPK